MIGKSIPVAYIQKSLMLRVSPGLFLQDFMKTEWWPKVSQLDRLMDLYEDARLSRLESAEEEPCNREAQIR